MPTDHTFTGQRTEGSLMDYGARFYSPILGRFISADSVVPQPGDPQSLNRYSYVRNSPLKYVDPTGHSVDCAASDNACWVNEWMWKERWYKQQRLLASFPQWDDPRHTVSDAIRHEAENAFMHLFMDPLYFANLYTNPGSDENGWGRNTEAIRLKIFAEYTKLHTSSERLLMDAFAGTYGVDAASKLYDIRLINMSALAKQQTLVKMTVVSGAVAVFIPGRPFIGSNAPEDAYQHLEQNHGLDPNVASNRLHILKDMWGLNPNDDVVIGRTGDVYDAHTGEWLGTLTDKSLGGER